MSVRSCPEKGRSGVSIPTTLPGTSTIICGVHKQASDEDSLEATARFGFVSGVSPRLNFACLTLRLTDCSAQSPCSRNMGTSFHSHVRPRRVQARHLGWVSEHFESSSARSIHDLIRSRTLTFLRLQVVHALDGRPMFGIFWQNRTSWVQRGWCCDVHRWL
jgi:hypothetical protein